MTKSNLQFYDDIVAVVGLKTSDRLLIIGDNVKFPGIQRSVYSVRGISNINELHALMKKKECFERVFIARENVFDERLVLAAAALVCKGGIVCFFSEDENLRNGFSECVERNFPISDIWPLSSNVGQLVATNARVS